MFRNCPSGLLALVDFPVAFGVESHLEEAIFGVVVLAAARADHVATPRGALTVVVLGDCESGAAAAGDEEHAEGSGLLFLLCCGGLGS